MMYGMIIIEQDRKKVEEWLISNVLEIRIVRKGWIAGDVCDIMFDSEQYRDMVMRKARQYFDRVALHNEGSDGDG